MGSPRGTVVGNLRLSAGRGLGVGNDMTPVLRGWPMRDWAGAWRTGPSANFECTVLAESLVHGRKHGNTPKK